jgi:hypothetical protein
MKVGLSLGRCVLDIIEGRVKFDDVLVIIAGTQLHPDNDRQWTVVWDTYKDTIWRRHKASAILFRSMVRRLYEAGKIHQPRMFGADVKGVADHWMDLILCIDRKKLDKS